MYKKYGIDLDGVLSDFTTRMRDVLNRLFDLKLTDSFVPTDWDWKNANLEPHMMKHAWEVIKNTPNFWENAAPTSNILTMANWFHDHGDQCYFITARVETAGRSAKQQTENWLREYLGYPNQDIKVYVTKSGLDKKPVLEELGINKFIDDHLDTLKHIRSLSNCKSYLLDQPWNRDTREGLRVVYSLAEFFNRD